MQTGIPCVSDCVIAELEKLGTKYRMALRLVGLLKNFNLFQTS